MLPDSVALRTNAKSYTVCDMTTIFINLWQMQSVILFVVDRFADFVEGNSWHVSSDEVLEYDSGPDPMASHLISDDEEEDEIDFMLNSQWTQKQ